ncbi:MAG: alpha/beta fold hydrolase [Marinicella sp.]
MKFCTHFALWWLLMVTHFTFASTELLGNWEGVLDANGVKLPLVIHLEKKQDSYQGSLDSPAQGAFGMAMTELEIKGNELMFEIASIHVHYEGSYDAQEQTISGHFIQGSVFQLTFEKVNNTSTDRADTSDIQYILGQWGGTVEIPGNPLSLVLHVDEQEGQIVSSADSPDQGATGLKVDQISLERGVVTFTMQALDVEFTGHLSKDLQRIEGDFKQQGMVFKLNLTKGAQPKQVYQRPQEPKPPFAYAIEEVVIDNTEAGIQLAGTLTRPKDPTSIKATAVMITGSGPQDRDETVAQHKPFWVIADHLTKNGYAVLRMDDRGVGQSTGDFKAATSQDFATDINAAVDFLQQRADIPQGSIGLIGHSEGGMIAPMVATQRDDLAFLILLAAPGTDITELLAEQKYLIARTAATDNEALLKNKEQDLKLHQKMAEWSEDKDYTGKLTAYLKQLHTDETTTEAAVNSQVESELKFYDNPWFRYFIAFKPKVFLSQVNTPVLALNGAKDLQVPAAANLSAIDSTLKLANNKDVTIKSLPGLNHLFQLTESGSPAEYVQLTETFSPVALDAMTDWLNQRF